MEFINYSFVMFLFGVKFCEKHCLEFFYKKSTLF